MNTPAKKDDPVDPFDRAVSQRLAQLGGMPVDTSAFDRSFKQQLPPPVAARRRWVAALSAVAASILIVLSISLALGLFQSRAVEASAQTMAQMHEDIVAGRTDTMKVSTIDDANKAIAAMSGNFPKLPSAPDAHTMACCMKSIGNKKVACVLLDDAGVPVTMSVAQASDVISPPHSPTFTHNGVTYHVEDIGNLHMVMTEHADKWICLISAAPAERLMDIAGKLRVE